MKKLPGHRRFRVRALALAVQAACGVVPAWALPQGAQVANGSVTISSPAAGTMQVNASNGAIINWQRFSIGAGEVTRFVQPGADSAVLNRVTGGEVSQILGQLQGNGRVFLINPSGIVVGSGARVDTNSFIASTLDIADADFLAGRLRFLAAPGAGGIRNDGLITAGPGGKIALIAPDIVNSGIIQALDGGILLAAGRKIEIASTDMADVRFEIQAPTDSVLNLGKLLADNGAIRAFAGTLTNAGVVRAQKLVQGADGSIALVGSADVTLAAGSQTQADGLSGGRVTVQSLGGTTRVAGTVSATGSGGQGGQVQVLGDRVSLQTGALVDASGTSGGGQVLVGGDFQGKNADVANARRVNVAEGAQLRADATAQGDGGRVIVWSDENTRFAGSLSAQGGAQGGNGGFAEVSGKANLEFTGTANLKAPQGAMGSLLLDPLDIIVASGSGVLPGVADEFADFADNVVTIAPSALDALGANVTLQANRDIFIKDRIGLNTAGASLTITAGGASYAAGGIYLEDLGAARPGGIATNGGDVVLRGQTVSGPGTITTAGGAVDILTTGALDYSAAIATSGGSVHLVSTGGAVNNANVSADAGTITVNGQTGVSGGSYSSSGTVNISSPAGAVGVYSVNGGTVNLQAQGYVDAAVATTDRVNAESTTSNVSLDSLGSSVLRLGTVRAATGIYLYQSAGLEQAAGGLLDTNYLYVQRYGSASAIGSSAAPLMLGGTRPVQVEIWGLAAPAHLRAAAGTSIVGLSLQGTAAALGGSTLTGGANLGAWSFGTNGGALTVSGSATGFSGRFSLRVDDAGLQVGSLNLQGGGYAYLQALGPVSLGSITTTRSGGLGLDVQAGGQCYTYAICTHDSHITATGLIDTGSGDLRLRSLDNGGILLSAGVRGRSIDLQAGGMHFGDYTGDPFWSYLGYPTLSTIEVSAIDATGAVSVSNYGNGNLVIGRLTAAGNVSLQTGYSSTYLVSPDGWTRTSGGILVANSDPATVSGGYSVQNYGTGGVSLTGDITRTGNVSVSSTGGNVAIAGNLASTGGNVIVTASGGTQDVKGVTAQGNVTLSAQGDLNFDKVQASFADVSLSSAAGAVKTRQDDSSVDVQAGGKVTITAGDLTNGFIGNGDFTHALDIRAGTNASISLSAGQDIGSATSAVTVDTQGTVDVRSTGGEFHVQAPGNVQVVRLAASADGISANQASSFRSANLNVDAIADATSHTITVGDPNTGNIAQSAGTLNEFKFEALGASNLAMGDVSLATTAGYNQLTLQAGGAITQRSGGVLAGNTVMRSGGNVTLGNVNTGSVVMDGLDVRATGDINAGSISTRSLTLEGANIHTGALTTTGTRRYWNSPSVYVPRFGYFSNSWTEEMRVTASGDISTTGNVSSATSTLLTAGGNIFIAEGLGSVSAGTTSGSYYTDSAKLWAGSTGQLRVGAVNGYSISLQGHDDVVGDLTGTNIHFGGDALTTGVINAGNSLTLSGGSLALGSTTASSVGIEADALTHTGTLTSRGNLDINVHGAYATDVALTAGGTASIRTEGNLSVSDLRASTVVLTTAAGNDGDISAGLSGTSNLTLVADRGFNVSTDTQLANLDITAQAERAAASSVGASVHAGGLLGAQDFSITPHSTDPSSGLDLSASASLAAPLNSGWNIRYTDTADTAVAGGLHVNVSHAQGGNFRVDMASATDLRGVSVSSPFRPANVDLETGGLIELDSVYTNGGGVTARSRGSDTVAGGIRVRSVVTDAWIYDGLRGGDVTLTADKGNIDFDPALLQDVFVAGISTADLYDGPSQSHGAVHLSALNGSVGSEATAMQVSYAGLLDIRARDTVNVAVTGDLPSLRLDVSLDGTGSVQVANQSLYNIVAVPSLVANLLNFTGLSLNRTQDSGGKAVLEVADVLANVGSPSSLDLTTRGGGISVTGNIANVDTLRLSAQGGDLSFNANGRGAALTVSTNSMDLSSDQSILVAAGAAATESVSLSTGTLQMQAGQDLKITGGGASAQVTGSTPVTSTQSLTAGRDFVLRGGTGDGAFARLSTQGGTSYQNLTAGGNMVIEGGSGAGTDASLTVTGNQYQQNVTVGGQLQVAGGTGSNAYAQVITQTSYQNFNVGDVVIAGGKGADAYAKWATTGTGYQSGSLRGAFVVQGGSAASGQGTGAYASFSGGNQSMANIGGGILVVGGTAQGNYAEITSAAGQYLGSTSTYGGYATDFIQVQGGSGTGASARLTAAGEQRLYAGRDDNVAGARGDISVLGGTGLNALAEVTAGTGQTIGSTSDSCYYYCNLPTHDITVAGGAGQGAFASVRTTNGSQNIVGGGTIHVGGGSGAGAYGEIATNGANQSQTIGDAGTYYADATSGVEVIAGSGGVARIRSSGTQFVASTGNILVIGGAGADMTASIESQSGSQTIGNLGDNWYANDATDLVKVQGGTGAGATASIRSATSQTVRGTDILVEAGTGTTAGAQLAAATGQGVTALNSIALRGGNDNGTGNSATGIRNSTSGNQSVSAGGGISLAGGAGASDVGILQQALTGTQTVQAGGDLSLAASQAGSGAVTIAASGGAQTIAAGGAIVLDNQAADDVSLQSQGGAQAVSAQSLRINLAGTRAGAFAGVVSGTGFDQSITLTGDGSTAGSASLSLSNTSTGAGTTLGVQSGGALALRVSDSNYDTAGAIQVGQAGDLGASTISAAGDMDIVAGSLTIQGGTAATADAAVNALGTMNISTVAGSVKLLGGAGGAGGSAAIDPPLLNVVSTGSALLQGGGGAGATSGITAGVFNLASTGGDLSLVNGTAAATINAQIFSYFGPGTVNLQGGTITVSTSGAINIGGVCINCGTNLFGPFSVLSYIAPPTPTTVTPLSLTNFSGFIASNVVSLSSLTGDTYQLVYLEDGSLVVNRSRRNLCL